jgi:ribonucleoside-diphosphate reductase alpha chain
MKLKGLSQEILMSRYPYPGDKDWRDRAKAIAKTGASVESDNKKELWEKKFFGVLKDGDFMPGGRIIYGSGRHLQNMLNCYSLVPEDNVASIAKTIADMYKISCGGGGIGFNFSKLRPKGDDIAQVLNSSPGSVSVMKMINEIGNHVRSGKNRRVALIAILDITHPDIIEFLTVKLDQGELINFNISVGVTDRFYEAVENDEDWYFVFNNRRYDLYKVTGQREDGSLYTVEVPAPNEEDAIRRAMSFHKEAWTDVFTSAEKTPLKARDLWDKIYSNSVESGDPGIYNLDLAKNYTNVSYFESLDNPNPCGEIPLPKYGNCCLGHINLDNMLLETKDGFEPDWKKIAKTVRVGVRFLDNILTANDYPIPECKEVSTKSRRIGLGITGLHYFLLKLGYRYGDESCCEFIERLAQTFRDEAYKASISVAKEKGPFEEFNAKLYLKEGFAQTLPPRIRTDIKKYGIRNAVMLTIAPVGTVSMLLGVSTGVEPIFSAIYKRRYRDGSIWKEQLVIDPLFRKYFEEGKDISNFVGAYDVTPEEHIKVQASLQKYVDSAISKTCNLPETATYEELKDIIFDYAPYVKGFTIYRAGSKGEEPLKAVSIQGLTREEIQAMIDQSVSYGSENEPEEEPVTMCDLTGKGCE